MTDRETARPRLSIDDDVLEKATDASKIMCLVPENEPGGEDNDMWLAVDAAIALARSGCKAVMFYDRSQETWVDTDHSEEVAATDIDIGAEHHLEHVLNRAADEEVAVSVWRSTLPTLGSGTLSATQIGGADFIVVPATGGRSNPLTDFLVGGSGDVADTISDVMTSPVATEAEADVPVAQVTSGGRVSLIKR